MKRLGTAALDSGGETRTTETRKAFRRLLRDRSAVLALVIVAVFVAGAVAAPWMSPHPPNDTDFANRFASPSGEHPLGTDHVGRDELSRLLHGARLSLGMALAATSGITIMGLVLGLVAGMYGRFVDSLIMRMVDVLQALPTLILALVVVGLLGQSLRNLIIVIALIAWPRYARIVRGMAFGMRERAFVQAARALGASRARIIVRHVAPNLLGPVIVLSTLEIGRSQLLVSGLSFLGFGVAPPTAEWGAMCRSRRRSSTAPPSCWSTRAWPSPSWCWRSTWPVTASVTSSTPVQATTRSGGSDAGGGGRWVHLPAMPTSPGGSGCP